jgi:hypothetical protein
MKTLWLTDPHLEFLESEGLDRFYSKMEKAAADWKCNVWTPENSKGF